MVATGRWTVLPDSELEQRTSGPRRTFYFHRGSCEEVIRLQRTRIDAVALVRSLLLARRGSCTLHILGRGLPTEPPRSRHELGGGD